MRLKRTAQRALNTLNRDQRRLFWAIAAGTMGASVLEFIGLSTIPLFLTALSGEDIAGHNPGVAQVFTALGIQGPDHQLMVGGAIIAAIFTLQTAFLCALAYIRARFVSGVIARLSTRLFQAYVHAPVTFHDNQQSAALSSKIVVETMRYANSFLGAFMRFLQSLFLTVAIGLLLVVSNTLQSLAVLGGLGMLAALLLLGMRRHARRHGQTFTRQNAILAQNVNEALGCLRHIRLRGLESRFSDSFAEHAVFRGEAIGFQRFANEVPKPILEGLAVLGILFLVLLAAAQGANLEDMLPQFGLIAAAVGRLLPHINRGTTAALVMQQTANVVHQVANDLNKLEAQDGLQQAFAQTGTASPGEARLLNDRIDLKAVEFCYPGAEAPSICQVSLQIPRNAAVAFVGPTGAGKSTLVDMIAGLIPPSAGRICIDGHDIADVRTTWQRHIGYIPQSIFLTDQSLRENVALGLRREEIDDARVHEVLGQAQLADFVAELPDGLETRVGENGVRLSGGQRQRIGIARALYHDPEVLVLDEATAALDTDTERRLMAAIDAVRSNRTLIMIAHRLSSIRNCDTIFVMENGRLTGSGSYDELLANHVAFNALAA